MIHPKTPTTPPNRQRKKRPTTSERNLVEPTRTIRLDEHAAPKAPSDVQEADVLGFFEALEQAQAQAEMAKMHAKKKDPPIAPDAYIPNSILRSMFKMKEIEPAEVKMFRLRLIPLSSSTNTPQMDFDERLKRYSVLTNFDGIHSTIFQSLNKIDILENLQSKTNKNLNWQNDDDEWVELGDPETSLTESTVKPSSAKTKSKKSPQATGTLMSRQKLDDDFARVDIDYNISWDEDSLPEVFKRMKNEPWWQYVNEDGTYNLRSMLMHLIDVLRDKEQDSYESACNYVVEIFRTYGIEPTIVDQILEILTDHLALSENDPLDIHTVRTIAQFMMERKNIIIALLTFTSKYQPDDILRQETINAIKFITDVNSADDIDLAVNNMPIVREAAEDAFSLKTIIDQIKSKQKKAPSDSANAEEEKEEEQPESNVLHPLLKKISDERWFPRDNNPITLDSVIDAILVKLPSASKTMLKSLTTHLVQLHRMFEYSKEQYDRVSNGLLSLLSHMDADYRLIAATILADLGKETKAIDIALLNSFLNDPRILVRTECCDSLKKITGVMSDTVLKDCADDVAHLQTLPEEDFSLQNYLKEKNRVPTPPPPTTTTTTDEQPSVPVEEETKAIDEEEKVENIIPTRTDEHEESDINIDDSTIPPPPPVDDRIDDIPSVIRSRIPSFHDEEQQPVVQQIDQFFPQTPNQLSMPPSAKSSATPLTPIERAIRVEISEKTKPFISLPQHPPPPAPPPTSSRLLRPRRQLLEPFNRTPIKITVSDQSTGKRRSLLPNSSDMWDSYAKQNDIHEEDESQVLLSSEVNQEQISDPIQTILDDHKRHIGYYRMMPNRPVLIPHKITFDDIFGDQFHKTVDQSHLTIDRKIPPRTLSRATSTMQLSDLNRNRHHLQEVEFVQLLSSLVIRAIQVHKKHERFIPGPFSAYSDSYTSFTDALNISQMQLHTPTSLDQTNFFVSPILPTIGRNRPSSAQLARMKSDVQIRAKRTGMNLHKAKDMEDTLSQVLKGDHVQSRTTLAPANTPHNAHMVATIDPSEVTHAWLLEQLLRSQGAPDSHNYIHQIIRAYPKFTPLLHSRIPPDLVPIIWNDPVLKQLASIISNKPDETPWEDSSVKRVYNKPSIPTIDDEHSSNLFDYSASSHLLSLQQQQREEQKKRYLPPIRGSKLRLPRHVLKFGFREFETESPETSLDSLRDESITKSRRRRIYMHLMMSVNENMLVRHELVKSQYRQMLKTDYQSSLFPPVVTRPPAFD